MISKLIVMVFLLMGLSVHASEPVAPSLEGIPAWKDITAKKSFWEKSPAERARFKQLYFDELIRPRAGSDMQLLRAEFLATEDVPPPGLMDYHAWKRAIGAGLAVAVTLSLAYTFRRGIGRAAAATGNGFAQTARWAITRPEQLAMLLAAVALVAIAARLWYGPIFVFRWR